MEDQNKDNVKARPDWAEISQKVTRTHVGVRMLMWQYDKIHTPKRGC